MIARRRRVPDCGGGKGRRAGVGRDRFLSFSIRSTTGPQGDGYNATELPKRKNRQRELQFHEGREMMTSSIFFRSCSRLRSLHVQINGYKYNSTRSRELLAVESFMIILHEP